MKDHENDAKEYLASLGEPALPERLWQRVEGARRRRVRGRIGAAMAGVAVLALGFALLLPGGMAPGVDDGPRVAEGPLQPSAPIDEADRVRTVQAIDRALQAGYDRNASDEELEPLWQARRALVHADAGPAASKG